MPMGVNCGLRPRLRGERPREQKRRQARTIPPRRGNSRRKMKIPFHPSEPGEEVGGTGGPTSAFPALEFWSLTEPREALASVSSNKLR